MLFLGLICLLKKFPLLVNFLLNNSDPPEQGASVHLILKNVSARVVLVQFPSSSPSINISVVTDPVSSRFSADTKTKAPLRAVKEYDQGSLTR